MFKEENRKYVKLGITGVITFIVCIIVFFMLYRIQHFGAFLNTLTNILMPFVYGGAFAYLLSPLCGRLEILLGKCIKKKKRAISALSILISLLVGIVLVLAVTGLIIPQTITAIIKLADTLPNQLRNASKAIQDILASHPTMQANWSSFWKEFELFLNDWIDTNIISQKDAIITSMISHLSLFAIGLKNIFLGVIIAAYVLANRKQFGSQSRLMLYSIFNDQWAQMIEDEVKFTDKVFNGFFMGKLIDSTIIGIICFIGCYLLGFESALLVSLIVGITNMIPFFGPYFGAAPSALILLLESPAHCVSFLVFILILQQIDGNILGPIILGDTTGLSGFWVLFSILLFGGLWGLIGMIVGIPVFAVIYDIIRKLTYKGLRKHDKAQMIEDYNSCYHESKQAVKS